MPMILTSMKNHRFRFVCTKSIKGVKRFLKALKVMLNVFKTGEKCLFRAIGMCYIVNVSVLDSDIRGILSLKACFRAFG